MRNLKERIESDELRRIYGDVVMKARNLKERIESIHGFATA